MCMTHIYNTDSYIKHTIYVYIVCFISQIKIVINKSRLLHVWRYSEFLMKSAAETREITMKCSMRVVTDMETKMYSLKRISINEVSANYCTLSRASQLPQNKRRRTPFACYCFINRRRGK